MRSKRSGSIGIGDIDNRLSVGSQRVPMPDLYGIRALSAEGNKVGSRKRHRQIGDCLADRARELEAMAGAGAHDENFLMSGVRGDEEVAVGGVRVEACRRASSRACRVRQIAAQ